MDLAMTLSVIFLGAIVQVMNSLTHLLMQYHGKGKMAGKAKRIATATGLTCVQIVHKVERKNMYYYVILCKSSDNNRWYWTTARLWPEDADAERNGYVAIGMSFLEKEEATKCAEGLNKEMGTLIYKK
jgi:hypothetical protein